MKKLLLLMTLTGALSFLPFTTFYVNAEESDQETTYLEETQMQEDEQGYIDEDIIDDESEASYSDEEPTDTNEEMNQE